jgi:hypothetical protein
MIGISHSRQHVAKMNPMQEIFENRSDPDLLCQ